MKVVIKGALFFCLFLFSPLTRAKEPKHICKNYYLISDDQLFSLSFSTNEINLICGDGTPGWTEVPKTQALFHIRTFLQKRGYFEPKIETSKENTLISLGPQSHLNRIDFEGAPDAFFEVNHNAILGETLNSELLEEIKGWTENRLKSLGYPCPSVQVEAYYKDSLVRVQIETGQRAHIKNIVRSGYGDLNPKALSRFDAMKVGDPYNVDFFRLTSIRLTSSKLVDYAYFNYNCEGPEGDAGVFEQILNLGDPHYLTFGIGGSTEELPILKSSWQHTRLDDMASSFNADLHASPIHQSIGAQLRAFLLEDYPRWYLAPRIEIEREAEDIFEAIYQKFGLSTGYLIDSKLARFHLSGSSVLNLESVQEGESPSETKFISLESTFEFMSHYYEYFQFSPRTGAQFTLSWQSQLPSFSSSSVGNKLTASGTTLWNLGAFDPPKVVLGARFIHSTLNALNLSSAPQSFRQYLGGDRNIRGFSRNSINNNSKGFITTSYLGLEIRLLSLLPYKIQPFLFLDSAKVGLETSSWLSDLFLAPGVGLRWESFIGAFRLTFARGIHQNRSQFVSGIPEEWTIFASYGQEF